MDFLDVIQLQTEAKLTFFTISSLLIFIFSSFLEQTSKDLLSFDSASDP